MHCKVNGVWKNLRYRILTIDNQTYILDMGQFFWKFFFPFYFWILPNKVYQVNNQEIIEELKVPDPGRMKTEPKEIAAGLIVGLSANSIWLLGYYFNLPGTPLFNTIIVLITFFLVLLVFFYINKRCQKSIYQVVHLKQYATTRLWIRPPSYKNVFHTLFMYLLFVVLIVFFWSQFIQFPNVLTLLAGMFFLLFLLFFGFITVPVEV